MSTLPDETPARDPESAVDTDVVVVGGGAAGLSAATFLARYGLDTTVFARGHSAIRQCAHLENYLGFPGGISPERFLALGRRQATHEGASVVDDLVEWVERVGEVYDDETTADEEDETGTATDGSAAADDATETGDSTERLCPARFRVQTQDDRTLHARYVLVASAYDGDYLEPLVDDLDREAEHGFVEAEAGRTPVEGLYAAGWLTRETVHQAIVNAGDGARAAVALARDDLRDRYWDALADIYVDWVVDDDRYGGEEWAADFDDWFDREMAPGAPDDVDDGELAEVREAAKESFLDRCVDESERAERERRGQELLLEELDDDVIREYVAGLDDEARAEEVI
ncbi:FAD-dependent oxidoreductase [Halobaculum sp. MBLA0147]|uniref:FAD-dependent oxidoreductase n=1 Tax=Halobaculum sp. MBLA0147 TaxID=3079934 RepID=UPI003524FF4A